MSALIRRLEKVEASVAGMVTAEAQAAAGGFERYREDPLGFVRGPLRSEVWSAQAAILEALAKPRARVSVRSGNGIGKTKVAAFATLWFLYTHSPCRVVTTATKLEQLRRSLWVEIRQAHARAELPGECDTLQLNLSPEAFAFGQVATSATSFQSHHAPYVLCIIDEAAGVEEATFEGINALLTSGDARLLLTGNPTSSAGTFYDSHHAKRALYRPFHVSVLKSPNFTGEPVSEPLRRALVGPEWVEERRQEWGEESPLYRARVEGEFPDQSDDALVALSWIEAARVRECEPDGPVEMGCDIARQGNCETVCYIRQGDRILCGEGWRNPDLMQTTGRIKALADRHKASVIKIDATGMGAGVLDRLKEQGINAEGVWVGERPKDPEKFVLLRDELWWNLRERLREGTIGPVGDSKTQAQLSAIRYTFDSRGRIKVEEKVEMSKRGLASPDRADALALAFADPEDRSVHVDPEMYQRFWQRFDDEDRARLG